MRNALALLEFFEGRPVDSQSFFGPYYEVLWELRVAPNRNTMDEVLSSGSLRLIRDARVRTGLLDLYATYGTVSFYEEHMARDFEVREGKLPLRTSHDPSQHFITLQDAVGRRCEPEIRPMRLRTVRRSSGSGGSDHEIQAAQSWPPRYQAVSG